MNKANKFKLDTTEQSSYEKYLKSEDFDYLSYEQFIEQELEFKYDTFYNELLNSGLNDYPCLIVGILDLWDGKKEIKPVICDSLSKAIDKCWQDDNIIKLEDFSIQMEAIHHDGNNKFTLIPICNNYDIEIIDDGDISDFISKSALDLHNFFE